MPDPRVYDPARPHDEVAHYLPDGTPTPVPAGLVADWIAGLAELNKQLADRFRKRKICFDFAGSTAFQLDSSGNGILPIYQVGAGFYATITRVALEAASYDTTSPRTPAAPFTGGWAFLSATPNPKVVQQGQMWDFLPTTAGGQLFPAVGEYDSGSGDDMATGSGPFLRDGQWLVLDVHAGPPSQRVTAHYRGYYWGQES